MKNIFKPIMAKKFLITQGLGKLVQTLLTKIRETSPPRGIQESTLKWVSTFELNEQKDKPKIVEIQINTSPLYLKPKFLEETIHWKFTLAHQEILERDTNRHTSTFVVLLYNGRTWSDSAVINAENYLLAELSKKRLLDKSLKHSIFQKKRLRPAYRANGISLNLACESGNNYYHWMFEVLPRTEIIKQAGFSIENIDHFIVNSYTSAFQYQTLARLGISREKIIEIEKHSHVSCEKLIATPRLKATGGNIGGYFVCNFLQKEIGSKNTLKNGLKFEKIYISRAKNHYRQVINETDIIEILVNFGFKVFFLESLSLDEQVTLFASAKIIIAPHGAGLTNIVFCNSGTKLLEIFSPNYVHVCYWHICNLVGVEYFYLIGEGRRPCDYEPTPFPFPYRDNITININKFRKILNYIGVC